MEFSVERDALAEAVVWVARALPTRPVVPVLTGLLLGAEQGDKGETGATIVSWQIDHERFRASPLMSDGTVGPMLELRSLFEEYLAQTS